MIQNTRIRKLNGADRRENSSYVLYWMQEAQRTLSNAALEMAIRGANKHGLPVVVCFGLMDGYPEANARHYAFMLEGLSDCAKNLATRGISFVVTQGLPVEVAIGMAFRGRGGGDLRPQLHAVTDRLARAACQRSRMYRSAGGNGGGRSGRRCIWQIGIRCAYDPPKIQQLWDEYLVPLDETRPEASPTESALRETSGTFPIRRRRWQPSTWTGQSL